MALMFAICKPQPNWMPRKPKLMFQICQKERRDLFIKKFDSKEMYAGANRHWIHNATGESNDNVRFFAQNDCGSISAPRDGKSAIQTHPDERAGNRHRVILASPKFERA